MSRRHATEIEKLFVACSAIGFRKSDESKNRKASIVLGFDDEPAGVKAQIALRNWAKDDEMMIALQDKGAHMDVILIHTGSCQAATVRQLSFNKADFADFLDSEPQDRRVLINYGVKPLENDLEALTAQRSAPLVLFRYILLKSDSISPASIY